MTARELAQMEKRGDGCLGQAAEDIRILVAEVRRLREQCCAIRRECTLDLPLEDRLNECYYIAALALEDE